MKTLLVLEGGAFRGTYTAAIIDKFIEEGINIDAIIGVSAGALIAPNYYSRQIGRCLNINRKYCKDSRYMGKKSLIETGNFVNKDFAYFQDLYCVRSDLGNLLKALGRLEEAKVYPPLTQCLIKPL